MSAPRVTRTESPGCVALSGEARACALSTRIDSDMPSQSARGSGALLSGSSRLSHIRATFTSRILPHRWDWRNLDSEMAPVGSLSLTVTPLRLVTLQNPAGTLVHMISESYLSYIRVISLLYLCYVQVVSE